MPFFCSPQAAKEGAFPKQKVAPLNVEEFSAKMFLEATWRHLVLHAAVGINDADTLR